MYGDKARRRLAWLSVKTVILVQLFIYFNLPRSMCKQKKTISKRSDVVPHFGISYFLAEFSGQAKMNVEGKQG